MDKNNILAKFKAVVADWSKSAYQWAYQPTAPSPLVPLLSPTDDAEDIEAYEARLRYLLDQEDQVREIAITAPYAGGKSSFLKTFRKRHIAYNYVCISLGSFRDEKDKEDTADDANWDRDDNNQVSRIEKSIVQQLLYRTKNSKESNSRFRKIFSVPPDRKDEYAVAFSVVVWGILAYTLVHLGWTNIARIADNTKFQDIIPLVAVSTAFSIFLAVPMLTVRDLYKALQKLNITSFNPFKGEVALTAKDNDSIFNIYLEEIIYYFSVSGTNVVIFEDIDRFRRPEVFFKLKELNKLINDSADVRQAVRFIYALKDDVFKGSTRAKFFDAIIPIIPISNTANSYPRLLKIIEASGHKLLFTTSFLKDISVYLDDMRILKNIVSEFGIYKETLSQGIDTLNNEHLFSFIVYKNVYCDDFALLHDGKGSLVQTIEKLSFLKNEKKKALEKRISEAEKALIQSDAELTRSIIELNSGVLIKVIKSFNQNNGVLIINGIPAFELVTEQNFDKQMEATNPITFRFSKTSNENLHPKRITFKSAVIDAEPDYENRKDFILNKNSQRRRQFQSEIEESKEKINGVLSLSMKEMVREAGREKSFGADFDKPLLAHMIENGYLDEHFQLYITHFIEGAMTKNDMDFVMQVKRQQKTDPVFCVDNHEETLTYLSDDEYRSLNFLNYGMVNHILGRGRDYWPLKQVLLHGIKPSENCYKICIDIFGNTEEANISRLVSLFVSVWPDILYDISVNSDTPPDIKAHLIARFLKSLNSEELRDKVLRSHRKELAGFLSTSEPISKYYPSDEACAENFLSALSFIEVRFRDASLFEDRPVFLEACMQKNILELSVANLRSILRMQGDDSRQTHIDYSKIKGIKAMGFDSYLTSNIDIVAGLISDMRIKVTKPRDWVDLINNEDVSHDHKVKIIENVDFKVDDLSSVSSSFYLDDIVSNGSFSESWANISFILQHQFDDEVSESIFSLLADEDFANALCESDNGVADFDNDAFYKYVSVDNFPNYIFGKYMKALGWRFSPDSIAPGKLEYLIEIGHFVPGFSVFVKILEVNRTSALLFASYNLPDLLEDNDFSKTLSQDDFYYLIESKHPCNRSKLKLVHERQDLISLSRDNIVILGCFLDPEKDVPRPSLAVEICEILLSASKDYDLKARFLTYQIKDLNVENTILLLKNLGDPFDSVTEDEKVEKLGIKLNAINHSLAIALKHNGTISKITTSKGIFGEKLWLYFDF